MLTIIADIHRLIIVIIHYCSTLIISEWSHYESHPINGITETELNYPITLE